MVRDGFGLWGEGDKWLELGGMGGYEYTHLDTSRIELGACRVAHNDHVAFPECCSAFIPCFLENHPP